jgi:hypothetical protein
MTIGVNHTKRKLAANESVLAMAVNQMRTPWLRRDLYQRPERLTDLHRRGRPMSSGLSRGLWRPSTSFVWQ